MEFLRFAEAIYQTPQPMKRLHSAGKFFPVSVKRTENNAPFGSLVRHTLIDGQVRECYDTQESTKIHSHMRFETLPPENRYYQIL